MVRNSPNPYHAEVRLELVNTLYRQSPPIFLGNLAVVSLSIGLLWHQVSQRDLLIWAALIYGLTAYRIAMVWRDRRAEKTIESARARAWHYALFSGLSGCLWGALGVVFFAPDNTIVTAFICIVLAGMTGGSVASLSSYWPTYFVFALPAVLPFTIRSFIYGSGLFSVLGLLALFLLGVNLAYSRTLHKTVREAMSLRFENIGLIRQLTEEKERAEIANQTKSQFLAAASHDLRQPTHALGLYIATLKAMAQAPKIDSGALSALAQRLQTALKGMSQLLNVLLDISRLDAGVIDVEPRRFALQQEFDALESQFSHIASEKGLELRIRPTPVWLGTDAVLLRNILTNLVSNAIRYTERGGILVACRRRGAHVDIEVFDTGIGIASHQQTDIFREFFQIGNAARDREQGLGLGLAIVRRTAALLGTDVTVHSVPEQGSRFSIRLPVSEAASAPRPLTDRVEAGRALDPTCDQPGKTILVVDDDRDVLASMQTLLRVWGHTVIGAQSLEQAVAAAHAHAGALDMILTDFRLAKHVSGVDAIRAVFGVIGRTIPAVIITGDTSAEGINATSESGFRVVHKPLDPQEIQTLIDAQPQLY